MLITIKSDTLTPELRRLLAAAKRPKPIWMAGGKTLQVEIVKHLKMLQARGNAKGWPAQRFFSGKADSVAKNVGRPDGQENRVSVTIADPRFVHRITGGKVVPKRGKYLAIPLTAEAYAAGGKGSIKSSMPGLFVVKSPNGLFLVREESSGKGKAKTSSLTPLFKLLRSVTHRPHPEELPDVEKIRPLVDAAMIAEAKRQFGAQ